MVEAAIKGDSEHATNTLPSTGLMAASTRTLAQEIGVFDNPWDEKRVSISPSQGTVLALGFPLNLQEDSQYIIALVLNW